MKVEHNISRIKQLLEMYRMDVQKFLQKISVGLKNPITKEDVFGKEIKVVFIVQRKFLWFKRIIVIDFDYFNEF